jgi:hypothetical protein
MYAGGTKTEISCNIILCSFTHEVNINKFSVLVLPSEIQYEI